MAKKKAQESPPVKKLMFVEALIPLANEAEECALLDPRTGGLPPSTRDASDGEIHEALLQLISHASEWRDFDRYDWQDANAFRPYAFRALLGVELTAMDHAFLREPPRGERYGRMPMFSLLSAGEWLRHAARNKSRRQPEPMPLAEAAALRIVKANIADLVLAYRHLRSFSERFGVDVPGIETCKAEIRATAGTVWKRIEEFRQPGANPEPHLIGQMTTLPPELRVALYDAANTAYVAGLIQNLDPPYPERIEAVWSILNDFVPPIAVEPARRLVVSPDDPMAWLDGKPVPIENTRAWEHLKAIYAAGGRIVTRTQLDDQTAGRTLKRLPQELFELIESVDGPGGGHRLIPAFRS